MEGHEVQGPYDRYLTLFGSQSSPYGLQGNCPAMDHVFRGTRQPFAGAPRETRTPDLLITNQMLYRLSYRGLTLSILRSGLADNLKLERKWLASGPCSCKLWLEAARTFPIWRHRKADSTCAHSAFPDDVIRRKPSMLEDQFPDLILYLRFVPRHCILDCPPCPTSTFSLRQKTGNHRIWHGTTNEFSGKGRQPRQSRTED